jgi:hypothetical protein
MEHPLHYFRANLTNNQPSDASPCRKLVSLTQGLKTKGAEMNSVNETRQEVQVVRQIDFIVRDEGTIWLFTPLTPTALQFLSEFIQEDAQYFGDSLAVEHRYVEGLLHGLAEHGLKVVQS